MESYEVLLAILKKEKRVTCSVCTNFQLKRPSLDSAMIDEEAKEATEEVPEAQKVPKAKKIQPNLSQELTDSLSVLADTPLATSNVTQPNTQPNDPQKSLPDLVTESVDGAGCPCEEEDEEMPPLEETEL